MAVSAYPGWKLTPLPDKGKWINRNEVEYEGFTFLVAQRGPAEEMTAASPPAKNWCGWSSDENLTNIIGCFTAQAVMREYVTQIDALVAQGIDTQR